MRVLLGGMALECMIARQLIDQGKVLGASKKAILPLCYCLGSIVPACGIEEHAVMVQRGRCVGQLVCRMEQKGVGDGHLERRRPAENC